jgi:hypothetical protein
MATEYKNLPLSHYVIHNIYYSESGELYSYYLYIHSSGQAIIMRTNEDLTDFLFADAGKGNSQWTNRVGLNYITFDRLAKN